jgi:TonB family protein
VRHAGYSSRLPAREPAGPAGGWAATSEDSGTAAEQAVDQRRGDGMTAGQSTASTDYAGPGVLLRAAGSRAAGSRAASSRAARPRDRFSAGEAAPDAVRRAREAGVRRAGSGAPICGAARATWCVLRTVLVAAALSVTAGLPSAAQGIITTLSHPTHHMATVTVRTAWPQDSGCAHHPAAVDTVEIIVGGTLERAPGTPRLPLPFSLSVLDALRSAVRPPHAVEAGVFGPDTVGVPALAAAVRFTLDRAGTVRDVRLNGASTAIALDSALLAAVQHAADVHAFPPLPPALGRSEVDVTMALSSVQWAPAGDSLPARLTMFTVAVPRYGTMVRASDLRMPAVLSLVDPTAPPGDPNSVSVVQFVIDEQGRPIPATLRVVAAPSEAVGRRTAALLAHAQFQPASMGRCAVPQLMRLPLTVSR